MYTKLLWNIFIGPISFEQQVIKLCRFVYGGVPHWTDWKHLTPITPFSRVHYPNIPQAFSIKAHFV